MKDANRTSAFIAIPLAGDDAKARETVAGLIRDAGFVAVDAGALVNARSFDPSGPGYGNALTAAALREALNVDQVPARAQHVNAQGRTVTDRTGAMNKMIEVSADGQAVGSTREPDASRVPVVAAKRAGLLLQRIFRNYAGRIPVRLWSGDTISVGRFDPQQAPSPFTLVFRSAEAVRSLVLGGDQLGLAEAYIRDEIDVEGDFISAIRLKDQLGALPLSRLERFGALMGAIVPLAVEREALSSDFPRCNRGFYEPALEA